ncbi:MAG: GNAT family N-acetyltransferase, partial [Pseudomonadota bacterium]
MTDFSIRLARADDAAAFHEVEKDAAQLLQNEPSLLGIPPLPITSADEYRSMIAQGHCLSALSGDQVVGYAATRRHGREIHLHELSVATAFQRRRIGATLLNALKIDARNSGVRAITLHTFRDIDWNAPFYQRHGWIIIEDLTTHPRLASGNQWAIEY